MERERLLATAFDAGITHFDVARMYGLGVAERELGRFLQGKRDRVTIGTKAGILLTGTSRKLQWVQPVARWVIGLHPKLRRLAQRSAQKAGGEAPRDYSVAHVRESLETSRRELGVDFIDIFVLHEPRPQDLNDRALVDFLLEQRDKGRVGSVGISGECEDAIEILRHHPELHDVIQIPSDILSPRIEELRKQNVGLPVTFSAFSRCLSPILDLLKSHPSFTVDWSDRLGFPLTDRMSLARLLLAFNVQTNPSGITLFAATNPKQITSLADEAGTRFIEVERLQGFADALRRLMNT